VNVRTAEVQWNIPQQGRILSLSEISTTVDAMQAQLSRERRTSKAPTARVNFAPAVQVLSDPSCQTFEMRETADDQAPSSSEPMGEVFRPMEKRPGSRYDSSSMPWKYFSQIGIAAVVVWIFTVVCILVIDIFLNVDQGRPPSSPPLLAAAIAMSVKWPHRFFRPSALTCLEDKLLLGDSFAFYDADVEAMQLAHLAPSFNAEPYVLELHATQLVDGLSALTPWRSITLVCTSAQVCHSLLLLSLDGSEVKQHSLKANNRATQHVRTWSLSKRFGMRLDRISTMPPAEVALSCTSFETVWGDLSTAPEAWGLHAVTDQGEVVSFCALGGVLQPLHKLAIRSALKLRSNERILGLHVDDVGALWLLVQDQSNNQGELRSWGPEGGFRGSWQLPGDRQWAPGLCHSGHGETFVAAASHNTPGVAAQPELWRFTVLPENATGGLALSLRGSSEVAYRSRYLL